MSCRSLIAGLVAGCVAALSLAHAQQPEPKMSRVAVLMNLYAKEANPPRAFRQRLRDLGHVEGRNLVIDWRYQLGTGERLPALAEELVRLKPDVIVADVTLAIRAAMGATSTIPIVMASSADAVGTGLVRDIGRPDGNVTGVTIMLAEMTAKRLELLKQTIPSIARVGILWNGDLPWHRAMLGEVEAAAPRLRLQPIAIAVHGRELGDALQVIESARLDAVFVSETMTPPARKRLVEFANRHQLPTMFMNRDYVDEGGLMSYAPDFAEEFRIAARYVDRILRGAKVAELPVEQPTKFDLVLNQKTAVAIGRRLPASVLSRADEVIR
jgi:putative ABC transport system substrate-binding protein